MEESRILTETSSVKCSCYFNQTMKLPYIFTLSYRLEMPMFDDDLSHRRWHMAHYKAIHSVFNDSETLGSFSISSAEAIIYSEIVGSWKNQ